MDVEKSLPSSGIASLQAKIREYVAMLMVLKRKREDVKGLSRSLQALGDDIMESMREHGIPSCASQGYTFCVKDKTKMKSATAKTFLVQVKEYFNIADDVMATFVDKVDAKRRAEAEVVSTLECKPIKKPAPTDQTAAAGSQSAPATLSTAIDDMYSY